MVLETNYNVKMNRNGQCEFGRLVHTDKTSWNFARHFQFRASCVFLGSQFSLGCRYTGNLELGSDYVYGARAFVSSRCPAGKELESNSNHCRPVPRLVLSVLLANTKRMAIVATNSHRLRCCSYLSPILPYAPS